jgi:glutamate 5-kinase
MITERIENLDIGEVTIIDDGSGTAMANHVASLPNTVAAVLGAFSVTTGVDITDVLAPKQLEKELAQ